MNTENTHNPDNNFYTDELGQHEMEYQDAEIIDEEHDSVYNNGHSEEKPQTEEEAFVVEPQDTVGETQEEVPVTQEPIQEETLKSSQNSGAEADQAISILEGELHKEKDKFVRLFAEFENYKKRTAKERVDLLKSAGQDVIQAMLPILDDFDRAIVEISKSEQDESLLKGVQLIYNKLLNTLKSKGLELIEVLPSEPFDSEIHEAITQVATPSPELSGKIIDVLEKGYRLGEKIIRYPKVVVGQ